MEMNNLKISEDDGNAEEKEHLLGRDQGEGRSPVKLGTPLNRRMPNES